MATDWVATKLAYIHGVMTQRDLASKQGIKAAGLMARANKENWEDLRKQEQARVSKAADSLMGEDRVARLARFNEQDIKIADALKSKAAKFMSGADLSPAELRTVAAVFDSAQKIGRLALGASTENSAITTKELPSSVNEFV